MVPPAGQRDRHLGAVGVAAGALGTGGTMQTRTRFRAMDLMSELRRFEGNRVSIALAGGSRIDDCVLVSAPRGRLKTVWVHVAGEDVFLPVNNLIAVWETPRLCRFSAA
jgi:hypothetical protein